MRGKLCLLAAVIILMSLLSNASAKTYTLDECIKIALKNNYEIISARNSYDATRWSLYSAYGQILPSISISSNRNENWASMVQYVNGIPIPISGKTVSFGGNLYFSQSYAGLGLGTYANIMHKHAQRHYYYYSFINAGKDLVLTIKETYFNLIKTKMLVDVARDAVQRGQEQLRVAQSRYDLGSASLSDVLKAKVNFNNSRLDLINAENNQSLTMADLNYKMGLDVAAEIDVVEDLLQSPFDITYEQALSEAVAQNPLYKQANYYLAMTKSELCMAKANLLPSFRITLSHSTQVDESSQLLDLNKDNASYYFGVSLSFNLFNNFSDISNIKSGKKNVATSKKHLENTKNAVALEVKTSYLEVQKNVEKLKFNEESVAAASEDMNIVREKYNLGAATIVEVLDAEVLYKQAQINQVQALFDYNLAVSRLEKVMGR